MGQHCASTTAGAGVAGAVATTDPLPVGGRRGEGAVPTERRRGVIAHCPHRPAAPTSPAAPRLARASAC
eukprot:3291701-Alexandrium_andersonii.AAC.1